MNNYENLMRWVMNDIRDIPKRDKNKVAKHFDNYIMNATMNLDIHGVVDENNFPSFLNDLKQRIGMN